MNNFAFIFTMVDLWIWKILADETRSETCQIYSNEVHHSHLQERLFSIVGLVALFSRAFKF